MKILRRKKSKKRKCQSRHADARKNVATVPLRPLRALLSFAEKLTTPMKLTKEKKELEQFGREIDRKVIQSPERRRNVVQMSINNSQNEARAQMPSNRAMVNRMQRQRAVAHMTRHLPSFLLQQDCTAWQKIIGF